jgi:hypothetical protein
VLTTDNRIPDRFAEELSKAVAERGVLALLSQQPIPPYSELAIKVHSEPCLPTGAPMAATARPWN